MTTKTQKLRYTVRKLNHGLSGSKRTQRVLVIVESVTSKLPSVTAGVAQVRVLYFLCLYLHVSDLPGMH